MGLGLLLVVIDGRKESWRRISLAGSIDSRQAETWERGGYNGPLGPLPAGEDAAGGGGWRGG